MATMAGVLVISFPGLDQRRAEREAERLAGLLGLACEQAELSGRNIGLHLATGGYGFSVADAADWLWFEGDHRFRRRTVDGLELAIPGARLPVQAEPGQPPHAQCWPAGELSALEVRFVHAGQVRARVRTGADALPVVEFSDDGRDWRAPR